jgi:hypothetical protein
MRLISNLEVNADTPPLALQSTIVLDIEVTSNHKAMWYVSFVRKILKIMISYKQTLTAFLTSGIHQVSVGERSLVTS